MMNLNELAPALAKAQGALKNPNKNKTVTVQTRSGAPYKYSYADLPEILDTIRKPLSENGLAVLQVVKDGNLVTMLTHSSGQCITSEIPLELSGPPQEVGSRLTYLRRYSLISLLNIAADDDDDASSTLAATVAITPKAKAKKAPESNPQTSGDEYRIPLGQYAGKKPSELRLIELEAFLSELVSKMEAAGKTIDQLPQQTARLMRELREDKDRRAFENQENKNV